jgi:pentose-5-phosphate-3-epimerase
MAFSVALQIYSIRDFAEKDLKESLRKVKEMGYDGVEFAGLYGHAPAEVKCMVEELGLIPVSAHVSLDEMLADPDKVIGGYKEIGCKYIAVPYLNEDRRPGTDRFAQTIKDIEMLASVARKFGIQMLYHNHDFEFKKVDGEYGLDVLYQSVPSDLLQTEIDTCWVNVAGEDPADYVMLKIEVETRNLEDVAKVIATGKVNRIMLDNFSPEMIVNALSVIGGRYETEASGGINFENLEQYAATGVDFISSGAIIHQAVSLDLSLKAIF